jgi:hypothetical protein
VINTNSIWAVEVRSDNSSWGVYGFRLTQPAVFDLLAVAKEKAPRGTALRITRYGPAETTVFLEVE